MQQHNGWYEEYVGDPPIIYLDEHIQEVKTLLNENWQSSLDQSSRHRNDLQCQQHKNYDVIAITQLSFLTDYNHSTWQYYIVTLTYT